MEHRSKCYVLSCNVPTSYRHPTDSSPTVGRLLAKICRPSVGQQSVDSRPTVDIQTANRCVFRDYCMSLSLAEFSIFISGLCIKQIFFVVYTQVSIPERVSAEEFVEWMIAEPQTIVWLPTLHRLAVSETGTICGPIPGKRSLWRSTGNQSLLLAEMFLLNGIRGK